jgi:hypothetical protein
LTIKTANGQKDAEESKLERDNPVLDIEFKIEQRFQQIPIISSPLEPAIPVFRY